MENASLDGTLAAMRRDFDLTFALAPAVERAATESLLAIRVREDCYALRVAEIGGLFQGRRIVPLPTIVGGLLGLVGFRGQLVPVYDLGALMGYPPATEPPRWLTLLHQAEPVAIAFDTFDTQLRVERGQISQLSDLSGQWPAQRLSSLAGAVRTDMLRPIVNLPAIAAEIVQRLGSAYPNTASPNPLQVRSNAS